MESAVASIMKYGGNDLTEMGDLHHSRGPHQAGGSRQEHLEYLADMLSELQRMAERAGCRRLSRMLAISWAEAKRETDRRSA